MSKTDKNLMDAFAGESQANRKYLAFADVADAEGQPGAAKVFRAAAAAETIHAHSHLRMAGKIGDTTANLKVAIEGETFEFTKMYPDMIADAKAEGREKEVRYLEFVAKAEGVHAAMFTKAAADPKAFESIDLMLCKVCGCTYEGSCEKCPICGAGASAFIVIK